MSSAPQHRRPHSPSMAVAFLEFDLRRELEQLHGEPEWSSGQNAKTLVTYDDFRVVLTALKAHARLPEHQTKGRISIQTISAHILVRAQRRTFDLPTGSLLALDRNLPHDVEAVDDSALLITIAWNVDEARIAAREMMQNHRVLRVAIVEDRIPMQFVEWVGR